MSAPVPIDATLARRLVDSQSPQWRELSIRPVDLPGVDNRTFRLGDELTVRLPSGDWYALQVDKEQRWLPVLAPALPLPIPAPVAQGEPDLRYPYAWSVYRWIEGRPATEDTIADLGEFAVAVARFLLALRRVDPSGGPLPGEHNWFRGAPVTVYAEGRWRRWTPWPVRSTRSWCTPCGTTRRDPPGRTPPAGSTVTWPWATCSCGRPAGGGHRLRHQGIGDPACDLGIAWTLLRGRSRQVFRQRVAVDDDTWSRGRGWALWKALITLAEDRAAEDARRTIQEVLADYRMAQPAPR